MTDSVQGEARKRSSAALGSGTTTTTSNGLNQQVTIGGGTATWDSLGNLTSDPTTGNSYAYDLENKLSSAVAGGTTRTLSYDPLNRLDRYNPGTATRFVYDGPQAAAELDTSGAIQHRYVTGDGADELLVDYAGSGTANRRFLGTDERGSVIALTDSSGALVGINTYDEYGRPGAANIGRYQYTGQKWLGEAGLYDYKARVYLPHLGIFAQADPIGQQDSPNLYAYVGDDPVNWTDPFGLDKALTKIPTCEEDPAACDVVITGTRRPNALIDPFTNQIGLGPLPVGPRSSGKLGGAPKPQSTQTQPCQAPQKSTLGSIANIADDFSDATAGLALGSLALAAVTSETIVGGLTFGGLSAGLGGLSALGAGVSATAKYFDGNTRGAISTGAGAVAGLIVPPAMEKGMRLATGGERLVAGVAGEGYGRMTSSIVCGGR